MPWYLTGLLGGIAWWTANRMAGVDIQSWGYLYLSVGMGIVAMLCRWAR